VLVTGRRGLSSAANLADRLGREAHDVLIYDALARAGVETNLAWLKELSPPEDSPP
jgi:CDP-paratose 2-epimerase